jgi:hypothetical protein
LIIEAGKTGEILQVVPILAADYISLFLSYGLFSRLILEILRGRFAQLEDETTEVEHGRGRFQIGFVAGCGLPSNSGSTP